METEHTVISPKGRELFKDCLTEFDCIQKIIELNPDQPLNSSSIQGCIMWNIMQNNGTLDIDKLNKRLGVE